MPAVDVADGLTRSIVAVGKKTFDATAATVEVFHTFSTRDCGVGNESIAASTSAFASAVAVDVTVGFAATSAWVETVITVAAELPEEAAIIPPIGEPVPEANDEFVVVVVVGVEDEPLTLVVGGLVPDCAPVCAPSIAVVDVATDDGVVDTDESSDEEEALGVDEATVTDPSDDGTVVVGAPYPAPVCAPSIAPVEVATVVVEIGTSATEDVGDVVDAKPSFEAGVLETVVDTTPLVPFETDEEAVDEVVCTDAPESVIDPPALAPSTPPPPGGDDEAVVDGVELSGEA